MPTSKTKNMKEKKVITKPKIDGKIEKLMCTIIERVRREIKSIPRKLKKMIEKTVRSGQLCSAFWRGVDSQFILVVEREYQLGI